MPGETITRHLLRPATTEDAQALYEWANDPDTRRQSFDSDPIPWGGHVTWLERVLADPAVTLWILCDPEPVASIRFAADRDRATVSVQVAPEARGQGIGTALIAEATGLYTSSTGRTVDAWIKPDNGASVRAFEAAGYRVADTGNPRRYTY